MLSKRIKLWHQTINNSVVICPICGKELIFKKYNTDNNNGWKIVKYDGIDTIICYKCYKNKK